MKEKPSEENLSKGSLSRTSPERALERFFEETSWATVIRQDFEWLQQLETPDPHPSLSLDILH